jgi:uncharacterized membrane protein YbhN (UPF0104 family)
VLGTDALLALYYLGFGFAVFLCWAIVADRLNDDLDQPLRDRLTRRAGAVAVLGIFHPAVSLAARDILKQVGEEGELPAVARVVDAMSVVGVIAAVAVIAAHMARFHDAPGLQSLRSMLPFER